MKFALSNYPKSYADGSVATGRIFHARQFVGGGGGDPNYERYPDPPGCGLSGKLRTWTPKTKIVAETKVKLTSQAPYAPCRSYLTAAVSGQPICRTFKGRQVQEVFLYFLALEGGIDRLSRTLVQNCHPMLCIIPAERGSYLDRICLIWCFTNYEFAMK